MQHTTEKPTTLFVAGERVVSGRDGDLSVGEVVATYPDGYVVAWDSGERTADVLADAVRVADLDALVETVRAADAALTPNEAAVRAARWRASGFSAAEAAEWLRVGCFDARGARRFEDVGIEPDEVSEPVDGPGSVSVACAVCEGDVTIKSVVKMLAKRS